MAKTAAKPSRQPRSAQGPRVNLTLSPEMDALLGRIAAATGTGKASFVRQWLEQMRPQLVGLVEALEQVAEGNIDGLLTMQKAVRSAVQMGQQAELNLGKTRRVLRRRVKRGE